MFIGDRVEMTGVRMGETDDASPSVLRFSLLGPVRAWRSGVPLDLGSPQQCAVLAVLLLRGGHAVTAAQLVDAVWGDTAPARAVAALRTYVSRLRAALEPGRGARTLLVSVGDGYQLNLPAGALDLADFERLAAQAEALRGTGRAAARDAYADALGLWRGTPLSGVPGPFADTQRDRLTERRLAVLESRLDLDLELGRHAAAIGELSALVAEHPLRERLRVLEMLALYRAGRQAEALAAYATLRALLVDELGIEPGPQVAELHARILAADPALAAPESPAGPARVVVPAQLPADVADFTGRAQHTAALRGLLTAGAGEAVPIVVVVGSGGVGKSALAVHVAHELREGFPDGQLYANLRGADARAADPEEVLAGFLRALGVPTAALPEGVEQRASLLRSTMAGRRVLMLLDGARDSAQVRSLLPGAPGCAVLVTGRSAMADLAGARLLDLGVLPEAEALALLARIAGPERVAAEPVAAREVVAACGLLPLAVRIVASRLGTRPSWSVAALAERLADERRRLDELKLGNLAVESSFQLSYAQLDDEQSRAFRLLAVHDAADLSLATAAALLDRHVATAEDLCESLVDACLLESAAPGHYRFHNLVRLYARRQTDAPERAAALSRLLDYYIATVSHVLRMGTTRADLPPEHLIGTRARGVPLADLAAARSWLAAERTGLFAAVQRAALEPDGPVALAMYLVLALCECVDAEGARGDAEWAMAALMGATGEAEHGQRPSGRLSAPLLPRGARSSAGTAQLTEACTLLEASADPRMGAWAEFLRGAAALLSGDGEAAVRAHLRSIALLDRAGESWGGGMLYALMIKAHRDAGSFAAGAVIAERALEVARRTGNEATEAFTLHELGLLTMLAGDPAAAVAQCRRALRLAAGTGSPTRLGYAELRLAQTLLGAAEPAAAARVADAAVRTLTEAADPSQRGVALAVLAEALEARGEPAQAARRYLEAAEVFARLGLPSAAELRERADRAGADS